MVWEAEKSKFVYLVARPLRGVGGGKGLATKKKKLYLNLEKKNSPQKCGH